MPDRRTAQQEYDGSPGRRTRSNELRREAHPDRKEYLRAYSRRYLLARYGLTPEDYDRMLAEQCGLCEICGQPPDPDGVRSASKLHADHDHETGRARDLLCLNCNHGLGCFRDDPAVLRAAADYIDRHRAAVQ